MSITTMDIETSGLSAKLMRIADGELDGQSEETVRDAATIIDGMAIAIQRMRAEVEYWKGMAPPAIVRDFPFKPPSVT